MGSNFGAIGLQQSGSLGFGGGSGAGSGALGSIGSPSLGLSNGAARRDSFDRNSTSTFSPSLDYGRGKWPQNYGALGTVTGN